MSENEADVVFEGGPQFRAAHRILRNVRASAGKQVPEKVCKDMNDGLPLGERRKVAFDSVGVVENIWAEMQLEPVLNAERSLSRDGCMILISRTILGMLAFLPFEERRPCQ